MPRRVNELQPEAAKGHALPVGKGREQRLVHPHLRRRRRHLPLGHEGRQGGVG